MRYMLSFDALVVVDAIDRYGSLTKAAEALYKVPSALTYTIQKVESDFGVQLFDREGKRMRLTPIGKLLLKEGRVILEATRNLEQRLHEETSGFEANLNIAYDAVIPLHKLDQLIEEFIKFHPHTSINLMQTALNGTLDMVHTHLADLAIGANGDISQWSYHFEEIGRIEFIFVVPPHHPLAEYQFNVSTTQMAEYPTVVIADSSKILPSRSVGLIESRQIIRVEDMSSKIRLQLAGVGIGWIPECWVRSYLDSGQLLKCQTPVQYSNIPMYVVRHPQRSGRALDWLYQKVLTTDWFN